MKKGEEIFCHSLIIVFGLMTISIFWWMESDYLKQGDKPKEISYSNIDELNSSVGSYVFISDVCLGDSLIQYEEDSKESEYYVFTECESTNTDSTHMFAVLENEFGILLFDHLAFEDGTVKLTEGELKKSGYFDATVKNMLNDMGVFYSEKECFILKAGKTPQRTKNKLIQSTIIISLVCIAGVLLVYYYYKGLRKK